MEWSEDNIQGIISFINEELSKGRTQREIEEQDFGVVERTIAKRLNRRGYKKKNNVWCKADENPTVANTQSVVQKTSAEAKAPSSVGYVIENKDSYDKLMDIVSHYDEIIALAIEWDKRYDKEYHSFNSSDSADSQIKIELPIEQENNFKTSVRINKVVWEQFDDFAKRNSMYTKRDLLSMALKEYMNKYDK